MGLMIQEARQPKEPVYKDVPLSGWLAQTIAWRGNENDDSAVAVRAMGTNALPWLINNLPYRKYRGLLDACPQSLLLMDMSVELAEYDGKGPTINLLSAELERQKQLIRAFRMLGPLAKPAVPELSEALNNPAAIEAACLALAMIGKEAHPALAAALTHTNPVVRETAVGVFINVPMEADWAVPYLILCTKDADAEVRSSALRALSGIDGDPGVLIPYYLTVVTNANNHLRVYAVKGLGRLGPKAKDSLATVLAALKDVDEGVRWEAMRALVKIDPPTAVKAGVVTLLIEQLEHSVVVRTRAIIKLLAELKQEARPALPVLRRLTRNQDARIRTEAASAMEKIEVPARPE